MVSDLFLAEDASYTKTEQQIIEFICQNPSSFLTVSISQLARRLEVSDATVSRFARHAGYRDFKDLKTAVAQAMEGAGPAEKLKESISSENSAGLERFLLHQQSCIQKTLDRIDEEAFSKAVTAICQASSVYIHGKGASRSLAQLLAFRLKRFGKNVCLLPSGGSELFEDLVHAESGDALITFGFQKLPAESKVLLKQGRDMGCRTILFCSRIYAELDPKNPIRLFVYRGEPEEYHSMTAAMAVLDALVLEIAAVMGESAVGRLDRLHQMKRQYRDQLPG